jgi:minichromosome maintenance protein 10
MSNGMSKIKYHQTYKTDQIPVAERSWPPKSPHAALLSSPSGRRKYQQLQDRRERSLSPTKRSETLPNLQRASRRLFDDDEDMNEIDDLDDDEETLQLKLAAIEAKLKLKKLQQNKERGAVENGRRERMQTNLSQFSTSSTSTAKSSLRNYGDGSKTVEVPVSPTKRPISQVEQRSPGRVLLGIDKGIKAHDISLRRARGVGGNGITGNKPSNGRLAGGSSAMPKSDFFQETRSQRNVDRPVKTFSERMAENRAEEQTKAKRREALASKRGVGFRLNHAEMESFKKAAEEARTHNPPRSPSKVGQYASFTRDDVLRSQGGHLESRGLKRSSTVPNFRNPDASSRSSTTVSLASSDINTPNSQQVDAVHRGEATAVRQKGDPSLYDPFSQLHLSSRVLPHSFLERTFPPTTHTCLRLPQLLKQVTAPAYELPGLESKDIVIVGVIASKSTPFDHKQGAGSKSAANGTNSDDWDHKWEDGSQNQKRFMILQLSDLTWTVDLFLFGTALPRYHRLSPGTVVAILNPGIMPPKKGKEDTGAFSLTLHHGEDTLLEVGTARDLGFCVAVKKDGKECGSWVNRVKTEVCEWHLNAQVTKTQAGRMGVNTGSNAIRRDVSGSRSRNAFGAGPRDGRNPKRRPQSGNPEYQFGRTSQSRFFVLPSSDAQRNTNCAKPGEFFERSAASLMELDDDDPFIAAGRLSRDTQSRLKKSLLNEEKERDIALKLTALGAGGAGGEYLRQRVGANHHDGTNPAGNSTAEEITRRKSAMVTKDTIMMSGRNQNGKRAADSVRLSPMKKTRFLTDKGIREAGRESLGGKHGDQDDDLDIV